jgi:hypothetical protein
MSKSQTDLKANNPKNKERIFFVCDQCMWTVTCLDKKYFNELTHNSDIEYSCPMCKEQELSSFPLTDRESFTYDYSDSKGLELKFG